MQFAKNIPKPKLLPPKQAALLLGENFDRCWISDAEQMFLFEHVSRQSTKVIFCRHISQQTLGVCINEMHSLHSSR